MGPRAGTGKDGPPSSCSPAPFALAKSVGKTESYTSPLPLIPPPFSSNRCGTVRTPFRSPAHLLTCACLFVSCCFNKSVSTRHNVMFSTTTKEGKKKKKGGGPPLSLSRRHHVDAKSSTCGLLRCNKRLRSLRLCHRQDVNNKGLCFCRTEHRHVPVPLG